MSSFEVIPSQQQIFQIMNRLAKYQVIKAITEQHRSLKMTCKFPQRTVDISSGTYLRHSVISTVQQSVVKTLTNKQPKISDCCQDFSNLCFSGLHSNYIAILGNQTCTVKEWACGSSIMKVNNARNSTPATVSVNVTHKHDLLIAGIIDWGLKQQQYAEDYYTRCRLTLNLLTTTIVAPPSNASKWQMGFNSAFKGLSRCRGLLQNKYNAYELKSEKKRNTKTYTHNRKSCKSTLPPFPQDTTVPANYPAFPSSSQAILWCGRPHRQVTIEGYSSRFGRSN